jgi:hypothetical protein
LPYCMGESRSLPSLNMRQTNDRSGGRRRTCTSSLHVRIYSPRSPARRGMPCDARTTLFATQVAAASTCTSVRLEPLRKDLTAAHGRHLDCEGGSADGMSVDSHFDFVPAEAALRSCTHERSAHRISARLSRMDALASGGCTESDGIRSVYVVHDRHRRRVDIDRCGREADWCSGELSTH